MRKVLCFLISMAILFTSGCSMNVFERNKWEYDVPKVSKHREPAKIKNDDYGTQIPKYTYEDNSRPIFLQSRDLSSMDLSKNNVELSHCIYDTNTRWPSSLPVGFDPVKIMEYGKDPGLNVRELHKKGVTGKNIGIAIIGESLYVDQLEYKDNIRLYEELGIISGRSSYTSSMALSLMSGKTLGVAPDSNVFYFAVPLWQQDSNGSYREDYSGLILAVEQILEINKSLPKDKKIRVIYTPGIITPGEGQSDYMEVLQKAVKEGIFVAQDTGKIANNLSFRLGSTGRQVLKDPNDVDSYEMSNMLEFMWTRNGKTSEAFSKLNFIGEGTVLVPAEDRTLASATGQSDYFFSNFGETGFSTAYLGAVYALACQVNSKVKPEEFLNAAMETSDFLKTTIQGQQFILGKLINPVKLIDKVEENK